MNSQNSVREAKNNKENGHTANRQQSKDKTTSARQIVDPSPKHYIVVETKKKKEVIQISSSESEGQIKSFQAQQSLRHAHGSERLDKNKKIKKTVFKCQLCKASGKKAQMKACTNCRHNFHMACVEMDEEVPKRYICEKCRFEREQEMREEERRLQQEQKQMAQELQKLIPKKTEKEKKKEEYSKRHGEFSARYGYYLQEDEKFKYPIQDKLLIIYREIFEQNNETVRPKPKSHPKIPGDKIADFLQIENFFSTFRGELEGLFNNFPKDIRKTFLYISMNSQVIDEIYSSMLYCLLKIYLSDIFDKNKTDNVKMLNENCFFTLLTNMNQNDDLNQDVIVQSAQQIIRYLSTIPSMKKSFEDFVFPENYNLNSKVYILVNLIKGLSQIDTFHEFVASKSQKMQNLTKQKGELVNQLKSDEADNLCNKQKIKEYAHAEVEFDEQLNKNEENGLSVSTRHITREKDKNKKKLQKLSTQKDKSQKTIHEIRAKISQISKALPFVTSQVVFLGKDRNESLYFFFCNEPNRIYCRYRNFLLDDREQFYVYEGKESIIELHKSLNPRGLHQKHLIDMISSFVKEEIIVERVKDEDDNCTNVEPYTEGIYEKVEREHIVQMVEELEETFSNYLVMKNLQWTASADREMFIVRLRSEHGIQEIKQLIISLQESFLFVEPIPVDESTTGRRVTVLDSDEDEKSERKEPKKKSPVRLWGINSERIKKYWVEYMEQCIDYHGVWICAKILKNYVDRYVKKKMEFLLEQQKKEEKADKQKERHRLRKERHDREPEKRSRERSREDRREERKDERERSRRGRPPKVLEESQSMVASNRPNLRDRKKRRFQIDSDIEPQQEEYEYQLQEQESQSEDKCEVCGEYGEMICCDSCPKVFHLECLKLKQIPEGEWNCVDCLEKIANQRQTRSRAGRAQRQSYI